MYNQASLPLLLKQLHLPCMYNQWEEISLQAQQEKWDYAQYLTALANIELANRHQKKIERHLKESALPSGKTLDTFDFDASPSVHAAQITALANTLDWVQQASNLMIFGPSGVGKTHIASAIGYRLIEKGARAFFTPTTTLVQKLQQARRDYKLNDYLNKLDRFNLLILDDIGYVKKDEAETSVLFELIAQRYENHSLVITSNQPFKEWDQIFPDNIMAVAAIDRLVHHSTIINITDVSYRRKQSTIH
ncbi:MAG: IS21-like element helper ATPase IstB [Alphaproteobacteria bacterium]